ncbi:hypothetical protein ABTC76_19890, partial [Acinetobacter baumannii]
WGGAAFGAALKLRFPGRFHRLGLALYLGLGWAIVTALERDLREKGTSEPPPHSRRAAMNMRPHVLALALLAALSACADRGADDAAMPDTAAGSGTAAASTDAAGITPPA